jgi:catechol 2,3-dioxygenase-like lactoylglutathione lyase family enzyme
MYHFAIEVDDAEAMRVYLVSRGVKVPEKTPKGKTGNANYFIDDPNGNIVEIVQYLPDGWNVRDHGKFMPDTRVSTRMSHVGVMVGQFDASLKFYEDVLGFKEIWRGSSNGKTLSWVNLQVPEGQDYVEFMLYDKYPVTDRIRTLQHICLEVPDVEKAGAVLAGRPLPEGSKPPTPMKAGINGKRQINYFDPDGTRVEIMEPNTFDGKPRPPSDALAPKSEPAPQAEPAPAK